MTGPLLPNTEVTGTPTVARVIHVGTHPDMERISPVDQLIRPTVFPTLVTPLPKLRLVEKELRYPPRALILLFAFASSPESVVILVVLVAIFPSFVVTLLVRGSLLVLFEFGVLELPLELLLLEFVLLALEFFRAARAPERYSISRIFFAILIVWRARFLSLTEIRLLIILKTLEKTSCRLTISGLILSSDVHP